MCAGSRPKLSNIPGSEHGITSDGFFELDELPKKAVVVGAGYGVFFVPCFLQRSL